MQFDRKIIKIAAADSPNVKEAERLLRENPAIPHEELLKRSKLFPGVLTYDKYLHRLATWDPAKKAAGLNAEFYEGAEVLWFPDSLLDACEKIEVDRKAGRCAMGLDAAEGGDNTAAAAVNRSGLYGLESRKTPNTDVIPGWAIALMREWNVDPIDCCLDRGGGGKQHADRMRGQGFDVRTVAFGESLMPEPRRGYTGFNERVDQREDRYVYCDRRTEMFAEFALLLGEGNFGLPRELLNRKRADGGPSLRDQLHKIPKLIDENGRYWLPSKGTVTERMEDRNIETLVKIIGCSPDEADAVVLAIYGLRNPKKRSTAGVL